MPRAGLTREAVVEAAAKLADRDGLDAVTPARLGEVLNVKPPSLYKHVSGIDDIRRGLTLNGLREADARLQRASVGKSRDEALLALARAYRQFAKDRPGLYAASLLTPLARDGEVAAAGESVLGTVFAVLAGYSLNRDDTLHAMRGFRAIIHGFVSLDAGGGFRLGLDLDESLARLIRAFAHDLDMRAVVPTAAHPRESGDPP